MAQGQPTIESLLAFHKSDLAKVQTYYQGYEVEGGCKSSNPNN